MNTLKHKDVWTSTYRGIAYEIVKWIGYEGKPIWNYYLHINIKQIPVDKLPLFDLPAGKVISGRWSYEYTTNNALSEIYWHGGITFYTKHFYPDGTTHVIQAGCDWNHLSDQGYHMLYGLDQVLDETKQTINELWTRHPDLMVWCRYCGKYVGLKDGRFVQVDTFYCNACRNSYLTTRNELV